MAQALPLLNVWLSAGPLRPAGHLRVAELFPESTEARPSQRAQARASRCMLVQAQRNFWRRVRGFRKSLCLGVPAQLWRPCLRSRPHQQLSFVDVRAGLSGHRAGPNGHGGGTRWLSCICMNAISKLRLGYDSAITKKLFKIGPLLYRRTGSPA
jgi:hypothetical protein